MQSPQKTKTFLKQKRNRLYEEITREFTESGLNLSEIKIEDFALSRKKETIKFQNILQSKTTSKTGHQLLPKHMRRRQMSHNPFRIPRRNRLSNLTVNIKSKCKKHKRKQNNLIQSILRRAHKQHWLENHLWLAKRFIMQKYLNTYTIPLKRRDKGLRACYKYWMYHSCIHDMSYNEYFIIQSEHYKGNEIMKDIYTQYTMSYQDIEMKCMKVYEIDLYNKCKGELIGPVMWFWFENKVVIMNNAIISKDIYELLQYEADTNKKFSVVNHTHGLNCFVMFGKESLCKIYSILKSCENENEKQRMLEQNVNEFAEYVDTVVEKGEVMLFKVNIPKSEFKMNELVFRTCLKKEMALDNKVNDNDVNMDDEKYVNEFLNMIIVSKSHALIASNNDNDDDFKSIAHEYTERTLFMHRKKVDLKKLNENIKESIQASKVKTQPLELQPKKTNPEHKTKSISIPQDNKQLPKHTLSNPNKQTIIALFKCSLPTNENVYYLLFTRGFSSDLFRRFVYINTKPLGLIELHRFYSQHNHPIFPNDYPSTNAYNKLILEQAKQNISSYLKTPQSHRVNYLSIKNPSPFYPSWNSLTNTNVPSIHISLSNVSLIPSSQALSNSSYMNKLFTLIPNPKLNQNQTTYIIRIHFHTLNKSVPDINDMIYLPTDNDIQEYLTYIHNKQLIHNNLFTNKPSPISDINLINTTTKHFHLTEPHTPNAKGNDINIEILSVLEYYNSNMSKTLTNKHVNADLTFNISSKPSHELIGFVTSGLYDYSTCLGKGIACIAVNKFRELITLKKNFKLNYIPALLRKKNSLIYYLISIQT